MQNKETFPFSQIPYTITPGYEIKKYNGSHWLKVFYHYNQDGLHGFENESEALYCVNDPYKYSIISLISSRYKYNGSYEFIIEYPELQVFNRWKQSKNPLHEKETYSNKTVTGFSPIETGLPGGDWGGLVKTEIYETIYSSPPSLLNGKPGITAWGYAVGQYKNMIWFHNEKSDNLIPANSTPVEYVFLWIRLPDAFWSKAKRFLSFPFHIFLFQFLSKESL